MYILSSRFFRIQNYNFYLVGWKEKLFQFASAEIFDVSG